MALALAVADLVAVLEEAEAGGAADVEVAAYRATVVRSLADLRADIDEANEGRTDRERRDRPSLG